MSPIDLPSDVIFDFDGTILNSAGNVLLELRSAIEKNGLAVPSAFDGVVIGPPMPQIIAGLFPGIDEIKVGAILSDFRTAHDNSLLEKSFLYPGILNLILALKARNVRLFIATNKPRAGLLNAVERFKLSDMFDAFACFGDEGVKTKADSVRLLVNNCQIKVSSAWMVGDAKTDITAGQENGLFTIAHLQGYSAREELMGVLPDLCVENYSELINNIQT